MKKILISILFISINFISHSQAFKASYTYDANGNRITANVIFLQSSIKSSQLNLDSLIKSEDIIPLDTVGLPQNGWDKKIKNPEDILISIYPNPVHGLLMIKITDVISIDENSLRIWNIQGNEMYNATLKNLNNIDFSKFSNGNYILEISIGNTRKVYKVIKN